LSLHAAWATTRACAISTPIEKSDKGTCCVAQINVLVLNISSDVLAELIADTVLKSSGMRLVSSHKDPPDPKDPRGLFVAQDEVEHELKSLPATDQCAVVAVRRSTKAPAVSAEQWFSVRRDLVVMHIDVDGDIVRIDLRNPGSELLLDALRDLVARAHSEKRDRAVSMPPLRSVPTPPPEDNVPSPPEPPRPTLLEASINWVHALLRKAVAETPVDGDSTNIFAITRSVLLQLLDKEWGAAPQPTLDEAKAALEDALGTVEDNDEPLAIAAHVFPLRANAFRLMVLTLAPEFNHIFQRCFGFLLDEMGRRVGTLGLISSLLEIDPGLRSRRLKRALTRWLVFEETAAGLPTADEPLRVDPFLARWLLGDRMALASDPRVRRVLRLERWPGASLLRRYEEKAKAETLMEKLQRSNKNRWVLLDEEDFAGWRALLELGARHSHLGLIRVETRRFVGIDLIDIEECARRIGRMSRLTGDPVVIDVINTEEVENESLRVFLVTLHRANCRTAVICRNEAHIVQLLGTTLFELIPDLALSLAARVAAVSEAARKTGAYITPDSAEAIANRYPLPIDSLEHAMLLASRRPKNYYAEDPQLDRLTSAFRELASEGISHLVERIEPVFSLDDVVLPPDRKQQLIEIVNNVRFASQVLDGWKFRDQLPYGRGVAALFFGVSGTGKTMAAMGIARRLGIQILRLDLSRVVNKYIGETEKNIDRVFTDAQKSGAAVLIDEADALLGKRSEVKEAHDRYANIEVAYLLQRIEAFDGLAILTTNMRMNLDPAFLRRLRFIIEFPKPNVEAREQIWRQCLPEESHDLDDADFRQLARRIDLTGGQIRQITLRAAFIAAAADSLITLEHIAQATGAELAKLGMPPVEIDLAATRRAA
jgi:AAA+ superfamily predicted ATPase